MDAVRNKQKPSAYLQMPGFVPGKPLDDMPSQTSKLLLKQFIPREQNQIKSYQNSPIMSKRDGVATGREA